MSDFDPLMTETPPTGIPVVADPTPVGGIPVVHRRRSRWPRRFGIGALALVVLSIGYYGVTLYQVHSTGTSDQTRPVDAIVVMGAAQYDGRPSPQLAARLDHAFDRSQGVAPVMVVTVNQPGTTHGKPRRTTSSPTVARRCDPAGNARPQPYASSTASPTLAPARTVQRDVGQRPFPLRSRLIAQSSVSSPTSRRRTSPGRAAELAGTGEAGNRRHGDRFKRLLSITG
jgi:hypothetical protein